MAKKQPQRRPQQQQGAAFTRPAAPDPTADHTGAATSVTSTVAEVAMDPTRFKLRKWIDRGKARVVKYVEVYMAAGLEADIRELDAQIVATKGGIIDERLAGGNRQDARLVEMARQVEELRAEMADSKVIFKFRGLEPGEFDKIKEELGEDGDDDTKVGFAMFARQCIQPFGLTGDDFADLSEALGEGYFGNTIIRAAQAANTGSSVDVPFSLNASEILRTQES